MVSGIAGIMVGYIQGAHSGNRDKVKQESDEKEKNHAQWASAKQNQAFDAGEASQSRLFMEAR